MWESDMLRLASYESQRLALRDEVALLDVERSVLSVNDSERVRGRWRR
jgi:hypothetical protein